jgi:para-nitrobenzyl esterase
VTALNFHVRSTLLAERKGQRGKAAVWMYRFDWETPAFGGRLKSPHSMDVPFVFDTLGVIGEAHRKPGAQDLADRVSATWATFARNADPANKAIPAWPAYTADKRTTMVFNDECQVVGDPDGEVRPVWSKIATA